MNSGEIGAIQLNFCRLLGSELEDEYIINTRSGPNEIFAALSVESYELWRKVTRTFSTLFKFLMFRDFMSAEVVAFDIFISPMGKKLANIVFLFFTG